ncbi:Rv3654c family TadE-like protein [Leifsonia sp. Leaf336]|uniref:Rv3654c family TadE-like protein n=1 Tax=Leifsonia sp. Leaf336 TaxID=1736341 RepID=UPI0009E6EA75|nr:Rv3654c family TadE-like protein [Leifsonia sp. Leaf336]
MKGAPWRRAAELGSGTVLALMTVAVVAVVTTAVMLVSGAWAARHRAGIAADAAALAAADVAVGRAPGESCARAQFLARANGASLVDCAVEGVVARVTAGVPYAGWQAEVPARAGPPGTP